MARPELEIDPEQVLKLARLHCTTKEIADIVGCSPDTIERRFAAVLDKGRAESKLRLRQLQWKAAERGNVAMLIFLGKAMLKQSDQVDEKLPSDPQAAIGGASLTPEEWVKILRQAREGIAGPERQGEEIKQ